MIDGGESIELVGFCLIQSRVPQFPWYLVHCFKRSDRMGMDAAFGRGSIRLQGCSIRFAGACLGFDGIRSMAFVAANQLDSSTTGMEMGGDNGFNDDKQWDGQG